MARRATATMAVQCLELLALPGVFIPTATTIRSWALRGKVRKYGCDQFGARLYDLDDIVNVAAHREATEPTPA